MKTRLVQIGRSPNRDESYESRFPQWGRVPPRRHRIAELPFPFFLIPDGRWNVFIEQLIVTRFMHSSARGGPAASTLPTRPNDERVIDDRDVQFVRQRRLRQQCRWDSHRFRSPDLNKSSFHVTPTVSVGFTRSLLLLVGDSMSSWWNSTPLWEARFARLVPVW